MLYVTTRNEYDAFTAYRTLGQGRGPDRGLFVPFQMPRFSQEEIGALRDKSFGQCVADILNLFYNARLDAWDVDFCIGRYPARMVSMSHKVLLGECWHNPDFDFGRMVRNLSSRIRGNEDTNGYSTNWAWITVRIAALFGFFGGLYRSNAIQIAQKVDIALPSGDFAGPMAAWYARQMGLPVGNIICCCDENDATWELLKNGSIYPNPGMNLPSDLERLICAVSGTEEARRFASCMEQRAPYIPRQEDLEKLRDGLVPAVISWDRRSNIIANVYSTSTYILDPGSAMAYGGLQDYRSSTGSSRCSLILTEKSPICSADTVSEALGISVHSLKERLNLI